MEIKKWKSINDWKENFPDENKFQKITIFLMPKDLHNKLFISVDCGDIGKKHYIKVMNFEEFQRNMVDNSRDTYQKNSKNGADIFYCNSITKEEPQNVTVKSEYFKYFVERIPTIIECAKSEPVSIPFVMALIAFPESKSYEGEGMMNNPHTWLFKDLIYLFDSDVYLPIPYSQEEEQLLIYECYDKERRKWEKLKRLYGTSTETKTYSRERIPEEVRIEVWRRDGGKCAHCGSREKLEYDHIVPISKGGSNTVRNIELLCERCNREKSNEIR